MDSPPPSNKPNEPTPVDLTGLDKEAQVQLAIAAIRASPLLPNGYHKLSSRSAATIYQVKRGTIDNRLKGKLTHQEAHAHECLLSKAEEEILVEWIKSLGRWGIPATADMVREYASVCITVVFALYMC